MAQMIPARPKEFTPESAEGLMFEALSKLPDSYYVLHSFGIVSVDKGHITESEVDFVVFNPKKGIICIEAKNGKNISHKNGEWFYSNGDPMRHGGPYNQAQKNKYRILDRFYDCKLGGLAKRCKLLHAVWFPLISRRDLVNIVLPPEGDISFTVTSEAISNPLPSIEKLFSLQGGFEAETMLTDIEVSAILEKVLCPEFNLVPSMASKIEFEKNSMNRLLEEQTRILSFLVEQRFAVISGGAGTGKTMLALEKARRHAQLGDSVLFLCYNRMLCEFLKDNYRIKGIVFSTINAYACSVCALPEADFVTLVEEIEKQFITDTFPYQHVIVDEGQDFGQKRIEDAGVLNTLRDTVLSKPDGSFYLFYDRNQLVQSFSMPSCIETADCKLSLYKNCRNTLNIARTSVRPLRSASIPVISDEGVIGDLPQSYICADSGQQVEILNSILTDLKKTTSDVVILTCKTEVESVLTCNVTDGIYRHNGQNYRFTSCRKFKGLEADAVVLIDIDRSTFEYEESLLFYAGASRARNLLFLIMSLSDDECSQISKQIANTGSGKPKKDLATALNTLLKGIRHTATTIDL